MENNILLFLLPKIQCEYVLNTFSLRQVIEKMDYHHYSEIPVLDNDGRFYGTISDGDILRYLTKYQLNWNEIMVQKIDKVPHIRKVEPIQIDKTMLELVELIIRQNFVPVVDDRNYFIGIITRKAVIEYMKNNLK
jgi:CBS domain-containing protein